MIDLRLRNIAFKVEGVWYSVSFRPKLFGRVADVKVRKGTGAASHGFYVDCDIEIDYQNISAMHALKMFWQSVCSDIKAFLRSFFHSSLPCTCGAVHKNAPERWQEETELLSGFDQEAVQEKIKETVISILASECAHLEYK